MTNEDKQALIERCKTVSSWREKYGDFANVMLPAIEAMEIAQIALSALTAQPVISDDTKRMDWLCAHCVEVRYPLMYGSREMFRAQQDSEEWDLPHHTTLREQVDAAIANEVQE